MPTNMALDPTDHTTWTAFGDHPIFADTKSRIAEWSHDPSCYCEPDSYGQFMPHYYVHVDPAPPIHEQLQIAERDIKNLASVCSQVENAFGPIKYELVILDDFTVYVWVQHPRFSIDIYPNNFSDETAIIKLIVESPGVESEYECQTVMDVIATLRRTVGT
jgi:hypothetical protein